MGILTSITKVVFTETRPLRANVGGLLPLTGSIVDLPFRGRSIASLFCLHVAEHVGLGRYGDRVDPNGTRRSAAELSRVLAPGGNLFFSLPIGRARVEFKAHQVHTPAQVIAMFPDLQLHAFTADDDAGRFVEEADPHHFSDAVYACGLFWFRRPENS